MGDPRIVTSLRLPTDLHAQLNAAADDRDVSANLLMTRAIERYLRQLPSVDDALDVDG